MDELREMLEQNPELLEFHGDTALGILSVATGELPCFTSSKRIIGGKKVVVLVVDVKSTELPEIGLEAAADDLSKAISRFLKVRAKASKES